MTAWKMFQQRRPTVAEIGRWYDGGHQRGVGLVCGAVSGGLEALDFDTRAAWLAFLIDAPAFVDRIVDGYSESSPRGQHLLYRVEGGAPGNTKLRTSADGRCSIETRGAGGYILVAPTPGYELASGSFATIATVTAAEHAALHAHARGDQPQHPSQRGPVTRAPIAAAERSRPPIERSTFAGELRPGDDFDRRGSIFELLTRHGWSYAFTAADGNAHFTRPGKSGGTSATWKDGLLYVWSTSTPFVAERAYSLFAVYAVLETGGDFAEAARRLAALGYGGVNGLRNNRI